MIQANHELSDEAFACTRDRFKKIRVDSEKAGQILLYGDLA